MIEVPVNEAPVNEATETSSEADGPVAEAAGLNRRAYPRRPCRYEALCRSAGKAWWPVLFADLSISGAGVMLASPVEAGAAVTFTVHTTPGQVLVIHARVRRVEPREGEWLAGCEFERLLTEDEFAELAE
jgi:hypothetical protein